MFLPNTIVRIKVDPGRFGKATDKTRIRADQVYQLIDFPDGPSYEPLYALEEVPKYEDPLELLLLGKIGRIRDLRGNLTYIRLNGRLANLIYSMDTTNTDFYPFQFKPVLNFIDSPTGGLLIADEVGLGKTIEAGLIWTELRSRFETRRLLVLCPAVLQEKWQSELLNKFGIDAQILKGREVLKYLLDYKAGNREDFAIIASMQGLRPNKGWDDKNKSEDQNITSPLCQYLKEKEYDDPLIDLLVIDEAHYLRNSKSMTSKLGALLAAVSDYKVFMSATPIHLKSQDLYQLLNILDEDTFSVQSAFDEILTANEPIIRARELLLKYDSSKKSPNELFEGVLSLLISAQNHSFLSDNRQLNGLIKSVNSVETLRDKENRAEYADRLERINLLNHVVNRTRKRDVTQYRVLREAIPEVINMTVAEAEFYSKVTALVRDFAEHNSGNVGFLTVIPQRQMSSSMAAALESWIKKIPVEIEQYEEDFGLSEEKYEKIGPLTQELIKHVSELGNLETLYNDDTKYKRLIDTLKKHLRENPKDKIVLFAYFKSTLKYLERRLSEDGIKCIILTGETSTSKFEIIRKFSEKFGPSVLLSSEVASEGVDLQFAKTLINYDLPWNPMKIEQRIGRIDRIGQTAKKIVIWNLFYKDTIDSRVYNRLYERLNIFQRALGDLEAIIGEKIQELTWELLSRPLTPEEEEERIHQTENAIANLHITEERLENEAGNLIAHGDYIINQIKAAQDLQRTISSKDLWILVRDFFDENYDGCEFLMIDDTELNFDIKLSEDAKYELDTFIRDKKLFGMTNITNIGRNKIRCQFFNKTIRQNNQNIEIVNQFHPLIRFVINKIENSKKKYYSPVGIQLDKSRISNFEKGIYVFSVQLWSLGGIRDIEKLNFELEVLGNNRTFTSEQAEKLIITSALEGQDWLTAQFETDLVEIKELIELCISRSESKYDKYVQQVQNENNDRADIQEKSLLSHKERQLQILHELIEVHRQKERFSLIKATEGKIEKLNTRVEGQLRRIIERRNLNSRNNDVCIGLIKIN